MKNYINNLSLDAVVKKREVTMLGVNTKVFKEMRDHLESLLDVFNHEYSESIRKDTKFLAKHYEYVL